MSKHKVKKYLIDIHESKRHIGMFTYDIRSFRSYQNDLLIRRAVERELSIIGEALNQLLKIYPQANISNARRIVDLRNRVIHGYDKVDDAIIWAILKRHLPILEAEVTHYLNVEQEE